MPFETAESFPLLQKLTRTLTTPEENPLDAAFGLDADQRIVGSLHEIGTKYSPEYCCEWVEKRDYSYCPFEHGLKVHWWFEQSWKTMGFSRKPFKHLTVFSPETVNIKKLADLTANTKNCGRITLNPIQTLQSEFVVTLDFRPLAETPFL